MYISTQVISNQLDIMSEFMSNKEYHMNQLIHSEILTVQETFSVFYDVPEYQREYVWQDEHIEQLLEDVFLAFEDGRENYFLGTIMVSQAEKQNYFNLIDGQQRLTTITLIFCAFKHYLQKKQIMPYGVIGNVLKGNTSIVEIDERLRLFPQRKESRELLEFLASDRGVEVNQLLLNNTWNPQAQSLFESLLRGYRTIAKWLDDRFPTPDEFRKYLEFFVSKVLFIRIKTMNITEALRLFETINERGVRLDAVSLLKNMLFMHVPDGKYDILQEKWQDMVKTVQHGTVKESAIRFIRYVVMAEYLGSKDVLIREDGLYNWFNEKRNAEKTQHIQSPTKFVGLLQERAEQYVLIRKGYTTNKVFSDGVVNIPILATTIRQHIPCLLAAQHLDDSLQREVARALECMLFIFVFTAISPSVFEKKITTITEMLRNARTQQDVAAVGKYLNNTFVNDRIPEFTNRMKTFSIARVRPNVLRYMMAKLTRKMMRDEMTHLNAYVDKLDYCHILPLQPPANLSDAQAQEYMSVTQGIGNIVMMERTLAANVRKGTLTFAEAVTRSRLPYVLRFTQPMPQHGVMHAIPTRWDVASVKARGELLMNLAKEEWLP
jgi:hypothetical protein